MTLTGRKLIAPFAAVLVAGAFVVAPAVSAPPCTITGTAGNDTLRGTKGDDFICGLGGNDKLYGRDGDDTIQGGPGHDKLYGGDDADDLDGGAGNDQVNGGDGDDFAAGDDGNDVVDGGNGDDAVLGDSSFFGSNLNPGKDRLKGGNGDDRLASASDPFSFPDDGIEPERVDCGNGEDLYIVAPGDVLDDCEIPFP